MGSVHEQASAYITVRRAQLATEIVDYQYNLQPAYWRQFGEVGHAKSVRDEEYHLAYLAEALATSDPSLFLEYVRWCKVFFTNLHFPESAIRGTFESMRDVLPRLMPEQLSPCVADYLEMGLAHLNRIPSTLPSFFSESAPLVDVARCYSQALLRGERQEAGKLIMETVASGIPVKDIYLHVFQPAQLEIGRLWQTNQITVAQEHYCTAATQMIMSQLYPYLFTTERIGRNLVVACVGGELHEIGARMVADFFELDGWDTYYLGANTPADSILRTLSERQCDILAISVTIAPHLPGVSELIDKVRATPGLPLKIIVGGYPFNVMPNLWQQVGADGFARDAEHAVFEGNRLIETTSV